MALLILSRAFILRWDFTMVNGQERTDSRKQPYRSSLFCANGPTIEPVYRQEVPVANRGSWMTETQGHKVGMILIISFNCHAGFDGR
jgi:hypothetical protein